MSLAIPIGQAKVRIRPDFTGFREDVRADVDSATAKPGTVKVTADTAEARARMDALRGDLDRLRAQTATAKIRLDGDTKAQASLDKIDFSLRRLGLTAAKPRISVDGAERAKIQLDEIEARLRLVGATTARPRVAVDGGAGGILNRLAAAGQGGFFGGRGLAIGALGSAAVPIGIAGAGAGAALLTPTVAGTIGGGLFLAATKSALTRVDKVQTKLDALDKRIATTSPTTTSGSPASAAQLSAAEQRLANAQVSGNVSSIVSAQQSLTALQGRGTTTTPNKAYEKLVQQRQALLNQLTPAERKAAEGTKDLEQTWVHFQRQLEPESFKAVATGTDILTKGLKLALPLTKATGDEIDHLFKLADKDLSDPFWKHFFNDFLAKEAPKAVGALGTSIGNVFTGIAHLAEDWAPLGHSFETDLVNITARFNAWTQGDGPGAFVALVRRDGPVVVKAIEGIAHGLGGVARGIEPIGRIELQALTPVLDFVGELGKQHPEVITALGIAYLGVAGGLKAVAAVKGIAGVVAAIPGLGGKKAGSKGLGGVLGGISAERGMSPETPLYVVVVNQGLGGSGGIAGTAEKDAATAGEAGVAKGLLSKIRGGLTKGIARGLGGVAIVAGTDIVGSAVGGSGGHVIKNLGTGAGLGYSVAGPPGALAGTAAVGAGYGVNAVAGSVANLLAPSDAESKVIAQLMANGKGLQNLARLRQIADNQVRDAGSISQEVQMEIDQLTKALGVLPSTVLKDGELVGTNLGLGLIQGIESQVPHATTAGKILVAQTAKQMRLAAEIRSPSQVTFRMGQQLSDGLALGITANTVNATVAADRLVAQVTARFTTLKQQVASTQQNLGASLLAQTGLSAFAPQTNAGGLPVAPTTAGLLAGLRSQDRGLALLTKRLHREHEFGLSGAAEQEIIGLGLQQGGAYAASLTHASRVQLRSLSRLLGDVHSDAMGLARGVTADIYGPQIAALLHRANDLSGANTAQLHLVVQKLEALEAEVRSAGHKAALR